MSHGARLQVDAQLEESTSKTRMLARQVGHFRSRIVTGRLEAGEQLRFLESKVLLEIRGERVTDLVAQPKIPRLGATHHVCEDRGKAPVLRGEDRPEHLVPRRLLARLVGYTHGGSQSKPGAREGVPACRRPRPGAWLRGQTWRRSFCERDAGPAPLATHVGAQVKLAPPGKVATVVLPGQGVAIAELTP